LTLSGNAQVEKNYGEATAVQNGPFTERLRAEMSTAAFALQFTVLTAHQLAEAALAHFLGSGVDTAY
jgi:hypothetical protein